MVDVQLLGAIDAEQRTALADLQRIAEAVDGHPGLSEPQRAALTHLDLGGDGTEVVLGTDDGAVVGVVVVAPQSDGSHVLQEVVDPARRSDGAIREALLDAALVAATGTVRLWVTQINAESDAEVAASGFAPERDLLQMRVPLPLSEEVTSALAPLKTRAFVPGVDDEEWLTLNNRAFAGHPEQGGWTLATLHERTQLEWFNAEGFRVATDDAGRIIGSCWTKIHRNSEPALGEIYVISVDPEFHGHHVGKRLAIAGLSWLADRGITHGMLYTDADNEAAVHLYRWLGFTEDHIDRCYITELP
jgi:mycothiol synthase